MKRKTIILAAVIGLTIVGFGLFRNRNISENQAPPLGGTIDEHSGNAPFAESSRNEKLTQRIPAGAVNVPANQATQADLMQLRPGTAEIMSEVKWEMVPFIRERYQKSKLVRTEERQDPASGVVYRSFILETQKKYPLIEVEQVYDPGRTQWQEGESVATPIAAKVYVADHVIVKLKQPFESEEVQALVKELNLTHRGTIAPLTVVLGFDRSQPRNSPKEIIERLVNSSLVEYAERDGVVTSR